MQACSLERGETQVAIPIPKRSSYEDDIDKYEEDKEKVYNPEYTTHHVINRQKEKTLKPDLTAAGFPSEIVNKADEIFSKMKCNMKKGERKGQLMFYVVHCAYNALRIPEDPNKLALMCGISNSEISKAFSMCSPAKVGYKPEPVYWQPIDYIRYYFQRMVDQDIIMYNEHVVRKICEICDEVMRNNKSLEHEKPQSVAAAVLTFYLEMHSRLLQKNEYLEIFNKAELSIQKIKSKVSQAYSS